MHSKVRRVGSTLALPKAGSTGSFGNLRARVRTQLHVNARNTTFLGCSKLFTNRVHAPAAASSQNIIL